jgi:Rps23 Pro-64 3,4-dihydroxylase Tpa1-like proline 4-hydroxylase
VKLPQAVETAPFAHLILDGALEPDELHNLQNAFSEEPRARLDGELYSHERGRSPPVHPALRAFCTNLAEQRGALSALFGLNLASEGMRSVDGAAYLYKPSDYLLPHSDKGDSRALAYVLYLSSCRGGELLLFDCVTSKSPITGKSEIVRTRPAKRIVPKPNRLVLFAVSEIALHQIREVTAGARASIAGWFYR